MFDNLSQRLARVVKTMRGEARLTEANTQEMLREIRIALLEADVALQLVHHPQLLVVAAEHLLVRDLLLGHEPIVGDDVE